jgi:hypothetical protein
MREDRAHELSLRLFGAADFVLAVVFLSPEAGRPPLGLTPPEFYVGSRAAPLGAVPGAVAAAVFGAIRPAAVIAGADAVWARCTPEQLLDARLDMARTVLVRVLGPEPDRIDDAVAVLERVASAGPIEGHPLYAGLLALPTPDDALGRLWRACDMIREHRGDSHVNAWRAAGLDGAEINVLTELWRGKKVGSEASVVNGWTEGDVRAALDRLRTAGLATETSLTTAGTELRERVEQATSAQERRLVAALGDDADMLFSLVDPWVQALREALKPPYWWHLAAAR